MSSVRLLAQGQEMKLKVKLFWQAKKGKRSVHNGYASVIYSTGWSPAQDNGANQTDNCKHTHTHTHGTHTHARTHTHTHTQKKEHCSSTEQGEVSGEGRQQFPIPAESEH